MQAGGKLPADHLVLSKQTSLSDVLKETTACAVPRPHFNLVWQ